MNKQTKSIEGTDPTPLGIVEHKHFFNLSEPLEIS
ncbi:hypothetical protein BH11PSE8_BH11PSE8_37790 [soil metagenome]